MVKRKSLKIGIDSFKPKPLSTIKFKYCIGDKMNTNYYGEPGTYSPEISNDSPFNFDLDYEKYEKTQIENRVLGYITK